MSSAVVSPSSFDVSKIVVTPQKSIPSTGAKQSYLNYDGRSLTMQVGSLTLPYGMSVYDKSGPVKYSIEMSLRGYDGENPKVKAIFDTFTALDEYMIQQGVKNSKAWFKQEMNRDIIKAFYTPCVRFSKDAEGNVKPYPPTVKVVLKKRDDKFETLIYDDKKRAMTDVPIEDVLVKGAQLTTLVQCTGVWFAGSKYGLSWKAVQIRVDKMGETIRGYAFEDDSSSTPSQRSLPLVKMTTNKPAPANKFEELADEEELDDEEVFQAPAPAPAKSAPAPAPAPVEDEDDDEDADDVAPVPVPKKTITKKSVMKVVSKK